MMSFPGVDNRTISPVASTFQFRRFLARTPKCQNTNRALCTTDDTIAKGARLGFEEHSLRTNEPLDQEAEGIEDEANEIGG